ncbi:hypothetical protein [Klebsiella sp. BIGb0407]|uniref:hypothetical protein n=1 Tax=Klebsiella sp. BIGb0407 TaxID=2940603 RepID=UPI00286E21AA|nr:hypothetical protein [Klebsiella sp. BIGb0407]MCS3430511.1 hypothetical protein [Klebsiella sp. BIGb0407]
MLAFFDRLSTLRATVKFFIFRGIIDEVEYVTAATSPGVIELVVFMRVCFINAEQAKFIVLPDDIRLAPLNSAKLLGYVH